MAKAKPKKPSEKKAGYRALHGVDRPTYDPARRKNSAAKKGKGK